ncbi:TPA: hypothetical protein DCQ22_04120 [Candidatus Nomurabacteria bacterium]|nr:hypothetical protein [Candidatus Nomurabacteria bacterium]
MIRGLFINPSKTNCSIYESGAMISRILTDSRAYDLDIINISREDVLNENYGIPNGYDFYLINWHSWALPIKEDRIKKLVGKKLCIVLEVSAEEMFPKLYTQPTWFDACMVIDPTKQREKNGYPFPRPILFVENLRPLLSDKIPVLGSFGLLTAGKRFEEIITNANKMDNCIVRINVPPAFWAWDSPGCKRLVDFANGLRRLAKGTIDLRITDNYMTQEELIRWCSENTINIFPYYRKQPGLSAVTDQAISSGRGIAVTNCDTFRHIHKYISYYPKQSYLQLAESSLAGVKKMQEDWSTGNFLLAFENMLREEKVL